MFKHVSFDGI